MKPVDGLRCEYWRVGFAIAPAAACIPSAFRARPGERPSGGLAPPANMRARLHFLSALFCTCGVHRVLPSRFTSICCSTYLTPVSKKKSILVVSIMLKLHHLLKCNPYFFMLIILKGCLDRSDEINPPIACLGIPLCIPIFCITCHWWCRIKNHRIVLYLFMKDYHIWTCRRNG